MAGNGSALTKLPPKQGKKAEDAQAVQVGVAGAPKGLPFFGRARRGAATASLLVFVLQAGLSNAQDPQETERDLMPVLVTRN